MKIDKVFISCYKHDFRFTRILVASIRHWHPGIPISLIKDERYGPFDSTELERNFDVSVFQTERRMFGWGFGKLEPLFLPKGERCLILDSDIVMVGPVLNLLERYDDDFVVCEDNTATNEFVDRLYFKLDGLKTLDPTFEFPGYTFNTGQLVISTGIFNRGDFDPFVHWNDPPTTKYPEIFQCGEQGLLNYLIMKKQHGGEISVARVPFMKTADEPEWQNVEYSIRQSAPALVLHWCGLPRTPDCPSLKGMPAKEVMLEFEQRYYDQIPLGWMRRPARLYGQQARSWLVRCLKRR